MVSWSVEVPAVRPTVANGLNQGGSSSAADWTCSAGLPRLGSGRQVARVVRGSPADDHDGFDAIQQALKRPLMLLGRQADRVDELDLGLGIECGHGRADRADRSLGRRRLADDSQSSRTDRPSLRLPTR